MKIQSTLIMLGVFLVAVASLVTVRALKVPTIAERAARQSKVLPGLQDLKPEDVNRVMIHRKSGTTLTFERRGKLDQWEMISPIPAPADPSQVRSIITDLMNLERKPHTEVRPATAAELRKFGLETPAQTIEIHAAPEGQKPQTTVLAVGDPVAGGQGYYVRPQGAKAIVVIDRDALASCDKKPIDYRQTKLLAISPYDATYLAIRSPTAAVVAEKDETRWRLVEPIKAAADPTKIDDLIRKATDIKVNPPKGFVNDNPKDLARYGLAKPRLVVEVKDPRQDVDQTLLIGSKAPDQANQVYAKLADQNNVVAIPDSVVAELSRSPGELRSRDLVTVDSFRVDYVKIERGAGSSAPIVLAKHDGAWKLYQPTVARADAPTVEAMVNKLTKLRAEEFLDAARPAEYGLDRPAAVFALWTDSLKSADRAAAGSNQAPRPEGKPVTIRFGKHAAAKKRVYVQVEGGSGVVAVSDDVWSTVEQTALAYRDKDVLSFSRNDVTELRVIRDGKTFVVRSAESPARGGAAPASAAWQLVEPVKAPAELSAVNNILNHLDHLRAEKYVAENPSDLKAYGLDRPRLRVMVTLRAEKDKKAEPVGLDVGAKQAGGSDYFARRPGGPLVFTVSPIVVQDLSAELRNRQVFSFDPARIESLGVAYGSGESIEFQHHPAAREPAGQWTEIKGPKLTLDPRRLQGFAESLAHFQADRYVYDPSLKSGALGLARPALAVQAKVQGEGTKVLKVGGTNGRDERYATTGAPNAPVFLISEASAREVLKGPGFFAQPAPAVGPPAKGTKPAGPAAPKRP